MPQYLRDLIFRNESTHRPMVCVSSSIYDDATSFVRVQCDVVAVENGIGVVFHPVAGVDVAAVFVQMEIHRQMTMPENKKIVMF